MKKGVFILTCALGLIVGMLIGVLATVGHTAEEISGLPWVKNGAQVYYFPGFGTEKVGIGTTNPLSKLSVGGKGTSNAGIYSTGSSYGIYSIGNIYGVYGKSDNGRAIYGYSGYGWAGYFTGKLRATDYYSGDGTQGMTGTCAYNSPLNVKDGLIVGCVSP